MRVLLDTQVLYVTAGAGQSPFSKRVKDILEDSHSERMFRSASIMEIAVKNAQGRLVMDQADRQKAVADLRVTMIPFHSQHAYRLYSLPEHHRDPFDRILIATALVEGLPIISGDRTFTRYKDLSVIW